MLLNHHPEKLPSQTDITNFMALKLSYVETIPQVFSVLTEGAEKGQEELKSEM